MSGAPRQVHAQPGAQTVSSRAHARPPALPAASVWERHLMAPVVAEQAQLRPADARRVQRLHDQLIAALHARDAGSLRHAKQAVLNAALAQPGSPALRRVLRALAWRTAALLRVDGKNRSQIGL